MHACMHANTFKLPPLTIGPRPSKRFLGNSVGAHHTRQQISFVRYEHVFGMQRVVYNYTSTAASPPEPEKNFR